MLKVAMVNTVRRRGGAARVAANLTLALNEVGTEATLYHSEDNDRTAPFFGLKKAGSRQINAMLARLGGSLCVADLGFTEVLLHAIADADVLHLHNIHGYYLDYRKLLTAWRDRPIVWTWHDMWGATGRCGAGYECTLWQSGCQKCPHMEFYPAAWIDRAANEYRAKQELFLNQKNLWVVSPSEWMAQIAARRGFPAERIKIIPNPISSKIQLIDQIEAREALALANKDFIALFVASDCSDDRKGYQDFAQVVTQTGATGIAIGKPPIKPHAQILHTGSIGDPIALNRYYAAADVMIIPSYADNYPNTIVESLVCGTPVIGYAVGGIPSQLTLPHCQIVTKGSTDDLLEALTLQINFHKKSADISTAIATEAAQRWSIAAATKHHIDLYQSAAARTY